MRNFFYEYPSLISALIFVMGILTFLLTMIFLCMLINPYIESIGLKTKTIAIIECSEKMREANLPVESCVFRKERERREQDA